ncbi:MAG TPA: Stp1/IreP family PP2C-type Ser/Thr phosphatase [Actinomycetota bacterium]
MKVRVGAATDVGRARERNEDSYLAVPPLYAVADGMGGHRGGNVASSVAMQVLSSIASGGDWQRLAEQVRQANHAILERARGDRSLQGMGTTITATYVEDNRVHLAQVGDSRAYLLRNGALSALTEDHTLVHEMVKKGQITEAEAEHHPQKSILTRALGVDEPVEVDEFTVEVAEGDRILLCSDGLWGMVSHQDLKAVLEQVRDPQEAAQRLVDMANAAGGLDNITVVIMDYEAGDGFEGATWTPQAGPATGAPPESGDGGRRDITTAMEIPTGIGAGQAPGIPAGVRPAGDAEAGAPPMPDAATPATAATGPEAPAAAWGEPPGRHRRRSRRVLVWLVAGVALLAVAFVGFRLYLDSRWFVGVQGGQVAVFRGVPTDIAGIHLFGLVRSTDISSSDAQALPQWKDRLDEGATADSEEAANGIVNTIRHDIAAAHPTPVPPTSPPTPAPSGSGSTTGGVGTTAPT